MRAVVLSGGVGGAKLVAGLDAALGDRLTVIVNTGDDFEHWGLRISPDLDTVMYTLAGLADQERGWGLRDETFGARDMMVRLGGPAWFNLGDRDLATHLTRTEALRRGVTLTDITARMCADLGVRATVLPAVDEPRPTIMHLHDGTELPFQRWFVERRCPPVRSVEYRGENAPTTAVRTALQRADAIILAPSNPYVSLLPILSLDGVRECVAARFCVAVSPIVGGRAVKGPLAAMLRDIDGDEPDARAIAARYPGLVDVFVVERGDGLPIAGVKVVEGDTVMTCAAQRRALADLVLQQL